MKSEPFQQARDVDHPKILMSLREAVDWIGSACAKNPDLPVSEIYAAELANRMKTVERRASGPQMTPAA